MNDDQKNWKNKIDQLKTHPSSLDFGMEWDALERRMKEKKKRRLVLWMWPVMLGLFAGFTYFYMADDHLSLQKGVEASNLTSTPKNIVAESEEAPTVDKVLDNEEVSDLISGQTLIHSSQENSYRDERNSDINSQNIKAVNEIQKEALKSSEKVPDPKQLLVQSLTNTALMENKEPLSIEDEDIEITDRDQINGHLTETLNLLHAITPLNPSKILVPAYISQKNIKPFFVDIRTSFGQQVYTFVPTTAKAENLVSERKKQEMPLESFGTRMSFGKEIGSNFYSTMGLSYVRINDRWQSTIFDTIDKVLDNQIIERYTNQDGLVTEKIGSKSIRQIVSINQTRYNIIQNISAIISVGRYFKIKKMRWAVEANMALPILTSISGQVSDKNDQMINIKDAHFKYKTIQFGMHTSYIYPVSGHLAVYGGYDYNFSKLTTDLGYIRKQNIHSISLGMKYFFNQ